MSTMQIFLTGCDTHVFHFTLCNSDKTLGGGTSRYAIISYIIIEGQSERLGIHTTVGPIRQMIVISLELL